MTDTLETTRSASRYPADSIELRILPDGRPLLIRPLAGSDANLLQDFVRGLSVDSRYQRFQGGVRELAPDILRRLLAVDYGRSMAYGAVLFEHGHRRMIGEARYAPAVDGTGATEFALAVSDPWQRRGIGRLLFERLLQYAEHNGIARMRGDVLRGNVAMLALARQSGFTTHPHPDGAWLARVERTLGTMPLAA